VAGEREILTITTSDRGWALVGEIDASNTATLDAALDVLPEADNGVIELDMSGVTFIDSSGLRSLVEFAHRTQTAGHRIALVATPRNVARLIDLAELTDFLGVRSSFPRD
jgi:anti-sigma B factor antagonist